MTEKKKRDYKREYQLQKKRNEHNDRMERQRARRKMDKTGKDANKNGKADKREGKDVAHKKPLSRGGSNKDGGVCTKPKPQPCRWWSPEPWATEKQVMAFPLEIWERARLLLMGGYRQDEVSSNLAIEFAGSLDEFQLEDLPIMVNGQRIGN